MMAKAKFVLGIMRTYINWWTAVLDSFWLFDPKGEKTYRLWNGLKFRCRNSTTDLSIVHAMFVRKENSKFIEELPDESIIIDAGACIGTFSLYATMKKPRAKIFCYEPLDDNYRMLAKNLELNKSKNIFPGKIALSDKKGFTKIYFSDKWTAGATMASDRRNKNDKSAIIKTTTINDIFKSNGITKCDLLKLDCEGVDYIILKSISKNNFKKIDRVHAEFHTEPERKSIIRTLSDNGFSKIETENSGEYGNIYAKHGHV